MNGQQQNTNALAENKTKNLTQSGAHTKDLPAQTFLRVSQTFGTHEKTIYAAVSQHIWPGQQTTADRPADKCKSVGQVNGQQSDKFGKKKKWNAQLKSD